MTNMFKKLVIGAALFIGLCRSDAAEYSITLTNAVTNVLSTAGWQISQISVTTGTTNAGSVNFYDNNVGANTYTNGAWVSRTTVSTNITTIFTNTVGLVQTNIYPGVFTYNVTNAASTNVLPVIASFTVPQASTSTRLEQIVTVKGLVAIPTTSNTVVTVTYQPTTNQ